MWYGGYVDVVVSITRMKDQPKTRFSSGSLRETRGKRACLVQWLSADEPAAEEAERRAAELHPEQLLPPAEARNRPAGSQGSQRPADREHLPRQGGLSPIPEGTEPTSSSPAASTASAAGDEDNDNDLDVDELIILNEYFDNQDVRDALSAALADTSSCRLEPEATPREDDLDDLGHYLPHLAGDSHLPCIPDDLDLDDKVYLDFPAEFGKLLDSTVEDLPEGQAYALGCSKPA